jgi:hypothetical protein
MRFRTVALLVVHLHDTVNIHVTMLPVYGSAGAAIVINIAPDAAAYNTSIVLSNCNVISNLNAATGEYLRFTGNYCLALA